jgi:hypothetical protein
MWGVYESTSLDTCDNVVLIVLRFRIVGCIKQVSITICACVCIYVYKAPSPWLQCSSPLLGLLHRRRNVISNLFHIPGKVTKQFCECLSQNTRPYMLGMCVTTFYLNESTNQMQQFITGLLFVV